MPLPDHPLVLHGGCNCSAIRYMINIPAVSERPLNPLSNGEVTFPVVLTDHCNDCRRAIGSILPVWICVPTEMMSCSLQPISTTQGRDSVSSEVEQWVPATDLFQQGPHSENYWLRFYKSSENATRTFCGRCGTSLTYAISPSMGDGWPDLFDVVLGTIDRKDLENGWMAPDRHCWVECEIPWVAALTSGGPKLPRHLTYKLNEYVE